MSVADDVNAVLAGAMPDRVNDLRSALALLDRGKAQALRGWLRSATVPEQQWYAYLIATYGRERIRLRPPLPGVMATSPHVLWLHCRVLQAALPAVRAVPPGQRWHPRAVAALVYLILSGLQCHFDDTEWGLDGDSEDLLRYARGYALYVVAGRDRVEDSEGAREWFVEHYEEALRLLPVIRDEEHCSLGWLEALVAHGGSGSAAPDSCS